MATNILIKTVDNRMPAPTRGTDGASGLDLRSREGAVILPGQTRKLFTGVAVSMPAGVEAQVRPRSSISLKGILIHLGTIDSDYRGEIAVIITNICNVHFTVDPYKDRIAQLVFCPVIVSDLTYTRAELSSTLRGDGGFGSTGV